MNFRLAEFDEVHVISDLHLGGRPGFQIFGSTAELAWLIGDLRQRAAGRIALVINGDFVDFLAQAQHCRSTRKVRPRSSRPSPTSGPSRRCSTLCASSLPRITAN